MKRVVALLCCVAGLVSAHVRAAELWRTGGASTPESIVHDAAHDRLILSNIAGGPTDADGNGYLSLLSTDGRMLVERWATGMDAPKGMAIHGGRLYVSDITKMHVIDLASGKVVETQSPPNAVFLNDVTATASGDVYVTDMLGQSIYRARPGGKFEVWLHDDRLNLPNGILAWNGRLVIGTWGKNMRPDFSTEAPGGLLSIDFRTKAIAPMAKAEAFGNIDGVVAHRGALIVSDYMSGVIWRYRKGAAPVRIATLKTGAADLGLLGDTLLVPMMNQGEVVALGLK